MGRILPIDRITIIRPEYWLNNNLAGYPCRYSDREMQNAINLALGGGNEHSLHGRSVVGAGEELRQYRGKRISGDIVADTITQMMDVWMLEFFQVKEKKTTSGHTEVPKTKVQAKWIGPETSLEGEPSVKDTARFLNAVAAGDLSIRGVWENHYESSDFISLILGPAEEAGDYVDWKFSRGTSFLFLDF